MLGPARQYGGWYAFQPRFLRTVPAKNAMHLHSATCRVHHACSAAQDVEVLVPNAGLALGVAPIHEIDLDDVQAMIDTNGELL